MMYKLKSKADNCIRYGFNKLFAFPIKLVCAVGRLGGKDFIDHFMVSMCKVFEQETGYFCSYRFRPMKSEQVVSIEGENETDAKVAIVIQGPVFSDKHFTLETVRTYGKLYPSAKVILSTGGVLRMLN